MPYISDFPVLLGAAAAVAPANIHFIRRVTIVGDSVDTADYFQHSHLPHSVICHQEAAIRIRLLAPDFEDLN